MGGVHRGWARFSDRAGVPVPFPPALAGSGRTGHARRWKGNLSLIFRNILRDLLTATSGSVGAIFLDKQGESVEVTTERPFDTDDHDLKVIGAYQGIFLAQLHRICETLGAGPPRRFKLEFLLTTILSCDLKDGYYLVLIVEAGTNEGLAWHKLEGCRDRLLAEM